MNEKLIAVLAFIFFIVAVFYGLKADKLQDQLTEKENYYSQLNDYLVSNFSCYLPIRTGSDGCIASGFQLFSNDLEKEYPLDCSVNSLVARIPFPDLKNSSEFVLMRPEKNYFYDENGTFKSQRNFSVIGFSGGQDGH
jgi:hypothetical protein